MNIVDRIIALIKRWSRYDELEDAMLLNRYGARNMDELWTMILMDRTAEPVGLWETQFNNLPARVIAKIVNFKKSPPKVTRRNLEEAAKSCYRSQVRDDLERKRRAREQDKLREYLKNSA